VAFTGRLGTADSQLGNIELGSEGGGGTTTTTQTIQLRANIRATQTQTIQLRANIRGTTTQSMQMRARIGNLQSLDLRARILAVNSQSLQLRANVLGVSTQSMQMRAQIQGPMRSLQMRAYLRAVQSLQMRGYILNEVTADLDVTFDAVMPLDQWLLVQYHVGDSDPNYKSLMMRANILQQATADLTVRYEVDYDGMPTDCISRPRTRVYLRTARQFSMRAHIRPN
jgi:hypothetical protein